MWAVHVITFAFVLLGAAPIFAADGEASDCTDVLIGFDVCFAEEDSEPYDRISDYPTWDDPDGDCQNNRHEVLISEHIDDDPDHPLAYSNSSNCAVATGKWYDPYDDVYYYGAPDVHIDHVVALKEAHDSGAWKFTAEEKRGFANNIDLPELLIAVGASSNLSKGARDPSEWMPSNGPYHCEYVRNWVKVKSVYGLSFDAEEVVAIKDAYQSCDTDGDGVSDEQEALDGTDPQDRYDCNGCFNFDIDLDCNTAALTDGLLVLRHLFGFEGTTLTNGALADNATRLDGATIAAYLNDNTGHFDLDGDGSAEALTDGLLLLRYLFGFEGATLIEGAVGTDATRTTAEEIKTYIQARIATGN